MYWPEELPLTGRLDYHAGNELIASNLMEIMDAMTVTDKAEVTHVKEEYTEQPAEGLFWRQKFDSLSNTLSVRMPHFRRVLCLLTCSTGAPNRLQMR